MLCSARFILVESVYAMIQSLVTVSLLTNLLSVLSQSVTPCPRNWSLWWNGETMPKVQQENFCCSYLWIAQFSLIRAIAFPELNKVFSMTLWFLVSNVNVTRQICSKGLIFSINRPFLGFLRRRCNIWNHWDCIYFWLLSTTAFARAQLAEVPLIQK